MSDLIRKLYKEKNKNCKTFSWEYATANQKAKLYRLAFQCSIEFMKFDDEQYVDKNNGEIYEGEYLRNLLKDYFGAYKIPKNLQIRLLTRWFNPKANDLLVRNGEKSAMPKDPSRFYFDYLSMGEASYLIEVFSEISRNIHWDLTPRQLDLCKTDNLDGLTRRWLCV